MLYILIKKHKINHNIKSKNISSLWLQTLKTYIYAYIYIYMHILKQKIIWYTHTPIHSLNQKCYTLPCGKLKKLHTLNQKCFTNLLLKNVNWKKTNTHSWWVKQPKILAMCNNYIRALNNTKQLRHYDFSLIYLHS